MEHKSNIYHDKLKALMDGLAHYVYDVTEKFPKQEMFGLTSQLRRAAISIILNYIEGYARQRTKQYAQFLDISYGSLKETKYLIYFCYKRKYIKETGYMNLIKLCDEIGKMLWGTMKHIKS
ncbi:MAG TPA: four helix bundle protein [Patescibacteria group bacterium]|nr:four helix bundle protein [Patescibacteria group bacterium]